MDFNFVMFVTVSLYVCICLGGAINIVISPDKVNGLVPTDVTFECTFDHSDSTIKEVMVLDLSRDGTSVAIIRSNLKLSVAEGLATKFQAEGNITKSIGESYLQVTMSNTELKDSGPYTCYVYYLDVTGLLKEKKASAKLIVSNDDLKSALLYLVKKVSTLETELSKEKNESRALTNQVKSQENQLQQQKQTQMDESRALTNQVSSLTHQVKSQENQLQQQKQTQMDESRALTNQVSSLTHQVKSQGKQLQQLEQKVMFTAVYNTPNVKLHSGDVLVFGNTIRNEGYGYNSYTGTFTAPVAGYYLLHLSLFINTDHYIYVELTGNGKRFKTVFAGEYSHWKDYSDGSCVARLEAGETVKPVVNALQSGAFLIVNNDQDDRAYNINTFSGYLLNIF